LGGLSVGFAAVIGNPKAILFYMGALPGFFTLEADRPRHRSDHRDFGG
jgi:threonine/homoserine/homoserine lactone efflux protein